MNLITVKITDRLSGSTSYKRLNNLKELWGTKYTSKRYYIKCFVSKEHRKNYSYLDDDGCIMLGFRKRTK